MPEAAGGLLSDRSTRRGLLRDAAYGAGSLAVASGLGAPALSAAARRHRTVALPTPHQVRASFQTMVDFGPRLTGNRAHNRFVAWLEREFVRAGCDLLPCDVYRTSRWSVERFGLDVLEGPGRGQVKVATYFPRSKETPRAGVTGPLVYGGAAPQPSINGTDLDALRAGLQRYPADVRSWASGLGSALSG